MSYDQTNNVGYIEALTPNVAFRNLVLQSGGGNVGIGTGTTSPTEKLSVAGTVQSMTGGFKFPDGSTQATAADTAYTSLNDTDFVLAAFPHDSIMQLNLPAGTYMLTATVLFINSANFALQDNGRTYACKFSTEGGSGDTSYRYRGHLDGASVLTTTFHAVLNISGTVELLCRTYSSAPTYVTASSRRLTAVKIAGLVVQ